MRALYPNIPTDHRSKVPFDTAWLSKLGLEGHGRVLLLICGPSRVDIDLGATCVLQDFTGRADCSVCARG